MLQKKIALILSALCILNDLNEAYAAAIEKKHLPSLITKTGNQPSLTTSKGKKTVPLPKRKKAETATRQETLSQHTYASLEQFSGALQWAHKKGIQGTNQTAIVLEPGNLSKKIIKKMGPLLLFPRTKNDDLDTINHGTGVIDAIHKVAPSSQILYLDINFDLTDKAAQALYQINKDLKTWLENAKVINYSSASYKLSFEGAHEVVKSSTTKKFLANSALRRSPSVLDFATKKTLDIFESQTQKQVRQLTSLIQTGHKKVLVMAAGNEGLSLSEPLVETPAGNTYHLVSMLVQDPILLKHLIIVGAHNQFFRMSSFSNFPGRNTVIQNHYIWAPGQNIKLMYEDSELLRDGTSFSAPTVTGCILLLMEKYPHFSPEEIQEVILESASKTFFIDLGLTKNGFEGVYVYDPEDRPLDPKTFQWGKQYAIDVTEHREELSGKGILDLRAAFIYADLKTKNPHLSKAILRKKMKEVLKKQNHRAATIIQKAFRRYLAKKARLHSQ